MASNHIEDFSNPNFLSENDYSMVFDDQLYDFDEQVAMAEKYIDSESFIKYLKGAKIKFDDGAQEDFQFDDLIGITLQDKNGSEIVSIEVKFENGSYVRLTNFPGTAPVINLSKVSEATPEAVKFKRSFSMSNVSNVDKAVVNTEDKEPIDKKSDAVIFGIKVKNGPGRYPYTVTFLSRKAFSDNVNEFKENKELFIKGGMLLRQADFDTVITSLVATISHKMADRGSYIAGKSLVEYLKVLKITRNGDECNFPIEDVLAILIRGATPEETLVVKVKFENGSYVRLTNFPGEEAPVIHLTTLEHVPAIA